MPKRATALTGAAGEHYVAYKLSHLGYPVAMTRGGSPTVDLMVGDISGGTTISIQVKTSNYARRTYKKKPENNRWLWDVGEKALRLNSENILYAFVDLKGDSALTPDVFLVESKNVANNLHPNQTRYMFGICENDGNATRNKWDLITNKLGKGLTDSEEALPETENGELDDAELGENTHQD